MCVNGWPISNQMAVVWIICPHTYVKHVQQNIYTHVMRLQSMFIYRFLFQIVRLQLKSTICHDWSSPNKHLQYICSKGILWGKLISLFALGCFLVCCAWPWEIPFQMRFQIQYMSSSKYAHKLKRIRSERIHASVNFALIFQALQ